MVAAVVTAMLVLQTAQAHPAPNGFPFPNLITRLQDVSVLLTAPRTTYVAGQDVRIHIRLVNNSNQALSLIGFPDWLRFQITIKNGSGLELQPNVQREMTNGSNKGLELPPHGSLDLSAAASTTLQHWGYALTTPGSYTIHAILESPNKTRIYSNPISVRVVLGSY
jgi:hypothetical protein